MGAAAGLVAVIVGVAVTVGVVVIAGVAVIVGVVVTVGVGVIAGVAGSHVRGVNSRGGITLGHRPRDINRNDVHHAVDAARNISLPEDRVVLHVLPQEFLLDAHDNIRDPLGMIGGRLEVNVHMVTS